MSRTSTSSNAVYSFNEYYNVNRGYSTNGLNQYTASGSIVPTYDVTNAGSYTYGYSTNNELVTTNTPGSSGLLLRRAGSSGPDQPSSGTTKFQYDAANIATKVNASNGKREVSNTFR